MSYFSLYQFYSDEFLIIFSTFLLFLVIYKITTFYIKAWSLPPGPFPLPIIGNLLEFRTKGHYYDVWKQMHRTYGPVFTFWLGNYPTVIIGDLDIAKEAFGKSDFAGRIGFYIRENLSKENHQDIALCDYSPTWKTLRAVTHSAAHKYITGDRIAYLVINCVDYMISLMIANEGINKEFDPASYNYLLSLNIIASSAFGASYSVEDKEFKMFYQFMHGFAKDIGPRFVLWEFSPLLRLVDRKLVKKHTKLMSEVIDCIRKHYSDHLEHYDENFERDFCDALITAKNDAIKKGKETAPHLNDENLALVLFDLIFAGTDTSYLTSQWILLLLAYYPEFQNKLRQEIDREIGEKLPALDDRNRCHYVMAFIAEVLRFRNAVPFGIPHSALVSSKIGDYSVPKGITVFVCQDMVLTDEKYWNNAHEFRPERFLINGKFLTTLPKAYIPFSIGRRQCVGKKLALAHLFLVLVRFFQLTSNYDIVLGINSGIEPDPAYSQSFSTRKFKIRFQKK